MKPIDVNAIAAQPWYPHSSFPYGHVTSRNLCTFRIDLDAPDGATAEQRAYEYICTCDDDQPHTYTYTAVKEEAGRWTVEVEAPGEY